MRQARLAPVHSVSELFRQHAHGEIDAQLADLGQCQELKRLPGDTRPSSRRTGGCPACGAITSRPSPATPGTQVEQEDGNSGLRGTSGTPWLPGSSVEARISALMSRRRPGAGTVGPDEPGGADAAAGTAAPGCHRPGRTMARHERRSGSVGQGGACPEGVRVPGAEHLFQVGQQRGELVAGPGHPDTLRARAALAD